MGKAQVLVVLVQAARHWLKWSVAQSQVSQKVQRTSLQVVTSPRHLVAQALLVPVQRASKVGPFRAGHRAETWALAPVQEACAVGAQPRYLPPPQMHDPFEPHCGNGQ